MRLWNFYGQTEMAPLATILRPGRPAAQGRARAGRAALNVETRVVDDDDQPRAAGRRSARSCTARPHAMLGYYDDEEKTAEAFRGGWFHSGDLGVIDEDGYLTVVDRKKDMIKTGGENVASREVEEAIYAARRRRRGRGVRHQPPALDRGGRPRSSCRKAGRDADRRATCIAHARERARRLQGARSTSSFADALPKNPSGKILKRELRATYAALAAADG